MECSLRKAAVEDETSLGTCIFSWRRYVMLEQGERMQEALKRVQQQAERLSSCQEKGIAALEKQLQSASMDVMQATFSAWTQLMSIMEAQARQKKLNGDRILREIA